MVIDALNGEIVNSKEIYIHDDILEELSFNRFEKKLHLSILEFKTREKYSIDFLQVIGFEMTSCDFWGFSSRILDFEYTERDNNSIITKLVEIKNIYGYTSCNLKDKETYFETVITFVSGDQLKIACEIIAFKEA